MAVLPPWYKLCSLVVINVLFKTGMSRSWGNSNPLAADDILKKHIFGNHHQCQRLCWYIELCERFSFYTKNLDGAHPYNCVLHAGEEKDDDLSDGWMQKKASGDYLPLEHECRNRTCGKQKVCVPGDIRVVKNVCNDLPSDVNECASSPCRNGTCVDGDRAYTCNCFAGYNGSNCETDINECFSSPCQNNMSCVDQVNAYTCNCTAGYTGDHCETDIDECESNPCPSGEGCEDTINGYNCCPPGYSGTTCSESWMKVTCTPDTDCTKEQTGCYSGHCLCKDGYFLSHSQAACVQTCDRLDTNYLHYKDIDLTGNIRDTIGLTNSTTCAANCSSDPQCITFIIFEKGCYIKSFTGQGPEGSWQVKDGAQMYQRTCE